MAPVLVLVPLVLLAPAACRRTGWQPSCTFASGTASRCSSVALKLLAPLEVLVPVMPPAPSPASLHLALIHSGCRPRRVARNPQYFLANQRSRGEVNKELLRTRFGRPRLAPIRGLAAFWDVPAVMDEQELVYFTGQDLTRFMSAEEFTDAWLYHPSAEDAPGAPGAPGADGMEEGAGHYAYFMELRCEFGFALEPLFDHRAGMMTVRCGGPSFRAVALCFLPGQPASQPVALCLPASQPLDPGPTPRVEAARGAGRPAHGHRVQPEGGGHELVGGLRVLHPHPQLAVQAGAGRPGQVRGQVRDAPLRVCGSATRRQRWRTHLPRRFLP